MEIVLFLKGLIIGFSIAAPVGPIGVLCINRSLHEGFKAGLITGLGAATADAIYGVIAGFGLTFISSFLLSHTLWIKLIGGIFLIFLGIKMLRSKPLTLDLNSPQKSLIRIYTTTFFLTLTNPLTIIFFMAIFAGLGLGSVTNSYAHASILILGIFSGSAVWWIILSTTTAFFLHKKIPKNKLYWINFISGGVLTAFGLVALGSLI